ncbi:MAG: MucBP domain-containing protein [Clostridia bacterium]|nr:MucBP domain-containing protein [Clostridia bacterium]
MKDKTKTIKKFFASLLLLVTCSSNSLFATVSSSTTSTMTKEELTDGDVELVKTASWEDIENGIARIDLTVKSKPVTRPVDIVLVVDKSGSMGFGTTSSHSPCMNPNHQFSNGHFYNEYNSQYSWYEDNYSKSQGCTDRLDVAKSAVDTFLDTFYGNEENKESRVALVTFSSDATKACDFTKSTSAITGALTNVSANGGTNYTKALTAAKEYIDGRSADTKSRPTYIIFLTDGNPDSNKVNGSSVATTLKENASIIYGIAIGTNVTSSALQNVSSGSGYFKTATTANDLNSIYEDIANKMKNAGTDLKVTDIISDDFEYYTDDTHVPTEGYVLSSDQKTISWNEKEIIETEKTYTFYVKIKDDDTHKNGEWPTNNGAKITYEDINGEDQEKVVPDPTLGRSKYTVEYYKQNEDGTYPTTPSESYVKVTSTGANVSAETRDYGRYYYLDTEASNINGIVTADGNLCLKLYYPMTKGTITVKYIDIDTNEIVSDTIVVEGLLDKTYTTTEKVISGYKLVEKPASPIVTFVEGNTEVIYKYQRAQGTITVVYVDESGNELASPVIWTGNVGEEYTTKAAVVANYEVKVEPSNATGVIVEGNIVVKYVYTKKSGEVIVNYVDEDGNKLADSITIPGKVEEPYNTEAKTIYGYELKETPANARGTIVEGTTSVTYVYAKKDTSVVTKYVYYEDGKEIEIADSKTLTGKVGEEYITESKNIYGYTLMITPTNAIGTMTEEQIVVKYIYTKTIGNVIVKYQDAAGNTLADSNTITGNVGDTYTTESKDIYGYEVKEVKGNVTGNITEDTIEVVYIYEKIPGSVLVKYVDIDGNVLDSERIDDKNVGDEYSTSEKEIYGYELVRALYPSNATGTVKEEETVVIYIYTKKDGTVVAKYVDEEGNEISNTETITNKVGDTYTTVQKDIYGYEFVNVDGAPTGTIKEEETVVTYTYKLKDAKVIVKYVDDKGNEISTTDVKTGKVFDKYTTSAKDIYGYEVVSTSPENAEGTMTEEDIIVTYVYTQKDGRVVVKYVDEEGNDIASTEVINDKVNKNYETTSKTIYGYTLKEVPTNATGKIEEEEIIVTYVYELRDAEIEVCYIDEDGNQLTDSIIKTGKVFDEYTTEEKTFYGYGLKETPDNATGKMAEEKIIVTYIYAQKDGTVVAKYVDEEGNEISNTETITNKVGDTYTTVQKDIYGYEFVNVDGAPTGTIKEEETVVTYTYKLKDAKVIVKYVDDKGNEISTTDVKTGKVFDKYTTSAKDIYGYEVVSTSPENAEGTMTEEDIIVTYIYTQKDGRVVVKYVDEEGNDITDPENIEGKVGDEYTSEPKDVYGYELKETPANAEGTIEEEEIVVTYEYVRKDGNVIVRYVDEEGNDIADTEKINGKVFDEYKTEEKTVYGYRLKEVPTNAEGAITEEDIIVIYEYERIEGEVKVIYVDEDGNLIADFDIINGYVGDQYSTEAKEIYGYKLTEVPENANGEIVEGKTEVVYVYKRITGTVRVEYIDKDGNVIADPDIISGFMGDSYEVSRKDINGYVIYAKDPDNQKGEFIDGEIVVTYIYEKPEMVNTGDLNLFAYLLVSILSLAGIFYAIRLIRKENE